IGNALANKFTRAGNQDSPVPGARVQPTISPHIPMRAPAGI
ncbi:hypothetical protein NEIPOLOT_01098, partial [Neisseria polysaccharea ATCC 43768]